MKKIAEISQNNLLMELNELRRQKPELEALQKRCQQAETALKAIEERNRLFGDSAPFGIFAADLQGRITGLNRKVQKMLPWLANRHPESMNIFEFQPLIDSGVSGYPLLLAD